LTPDQTDTLSDYAIQLEQVLAGVVPVARAAPGQSSSPILTIYGGDITIDGRKASVETMNTERPKSGQRFLMFLQPYGTEAGRYKIAYGAILEIENDRRRRSVQGGYRPFAACCCPGDCAQAALTLRTGAGRPVSTNAKPRASFQLSSFRLPASGFRLQT